MKKTTESWSTAPSHLIYNNKNITHRLLQLQGGLHGLQRRAPLGGGGPGDVLEHHLPAPLVLVLDELLAVLSLLVRVLLEVGGEPVVGHVVAVEVASLEESDQDGLSERVVRTMDM